MFDNHNHLHALTTVIGTLGGFQAAPKWFQALSTTSIWQILMAAVLVYQGGGNLDIMYSLVVAVVFHICVNLSNYIEFGAVDNVDLSKPVDNEVEQDSAQVINEETPMNENFYGY